MSIPLRSFRSLFGYISIGLEPLRCHASAGLFRLTGRPLRDVAVDDSKSTRGKINMFYFLSVALFGVFMFGTHSFASSQEPIIRNGSCPNGYQQSGNYCKPSSSNALPAIPKVGSCPSGYHQSGNYCLGNNRNSKPAVNKVGSCPSGYHQSGSYCLKN
jgi:hypothetical protein